MTTTSDTMDEATFHTLSDAAIERVRKGLDVLDPDVCEAVMEAGVLKITFPSGAPYVLNTQRPIRELWLAADRHAWHFRYDGALWIDKKGGTDELFATLAKLVKQRANVDVRW
jgi:CyaY protein